MATGGAATDRPPGGTRKALPYGTTMASGCSNRVGECDEGGCQVDGLQVREGAAWKSRPPHQRREGRTEGAFLLVQLSRATLELRIPVSKDRMVGKTGGIQQTREPTRGPGARRAGTPASARRGPERRVAGQANRRRPTPPNRAACRPESTATLGASAPEQQGVRPLHRAHGG